jgi:hypothetical protein
MNTVDNAAQQLTTILHTSLEAVNDDDDDDINTAMQCEKHTKQQQQQQQPTMKTTFLDFRTVPRSVSIGSVDVTTTQCKALFLLLWHDFPCASSNGGTHFAVEHAASLTTSSIQQQATFGP